MSSRVVAAALPVNYQTAWFGLARAGVGEGTTVLVTAAAGGVGIAAIQLAAARGARVIAAAGGPGKVAVCREQGADVAIDYLAVDVATAVSDATGGAGVDVVLDQVGGPGFASLLDLVAFEGTVVAIGTAGGPITPVDPMALAARNVGVVGLSWGSMYPARRPDAVAACYQQLFDLHRRGLVRPVISDVVALDRAPARARRARRPTHHRQGRRRSLARRLTDRRLRRSPGRRPGIARVPTGHLGAQADPLTLDATRRPGTPVSPGPHLGP